VRQALGVAALACVLAAPPAAAQEQAPCRAEVSLEPAQAFVGQQVVYRVRMLRRESVREVRWLRALSFPSLRAEWLPGRASDPRITGVGDAFLVSEDRRALFPVRAGTIEIPPASVGCRLASGGELEVVVPGATLVATPLPDAGRPAGYAGVVGPVQVRAHLSRRRLALGETLGLAVVVAGEANVWAAAAPLDPALPDVDVYPRDPELQLEPGDTLRARRTFVWELVPRLTGRLVLPAPRVPWFDPASGAYAVATGPMLAVEVREAPPPAAGGAPSPAPVGSERRGARARWQLVLFAALALVGVGGVLAARLRGRGRGAPLRAAEPALADAERALADGDRPAAARALAAALRAGLALCVPGAGALAAEEIAARAQGRAALTEAAELLALLDRARFAGPAASEPLPPVARVREALRAIGLARSRA